MDKRTRCLAGALALFLIASAALAQYSVSNYMEAGGAKWVVGGVLQFGGSVNTTGLYFGGGTSASPLTTAVADSNFATFYSQSTATSGTSRGIYWRHYLADTTPSGEAARFFTTVNTAGATDAHGAHFSLSYGASGTCTGESAAVRATLHVPNATLGGTNGATYSELYADGASSDVSNTVVQRYVLGGNATGLATLDDHAGLFSVEGGTIGSGNLVATSTATATHAIRIKINGTNYYLLAASAP